MEIKKHDSKVEVELESQRISYSSEWLEKASFLTKSGVEKLERWKIDLIVNYGVERDELRS